MNSQIEKLFGAIMIKKIEDQNESYIYSENRAGESENRVV